MKTSTLTLLALICACALPACQKAPSISPSPDSRPPARIIEDLERQVETERNLRVQAESHSSQQEASKSHWQTIALISITGAIVLLIIGTIIGARARHDAGQ